MALTQSIDPEPPLLPEQKFLVPRELIEFSRPAPRTTWMGYLAGGFVVVVLISTFASQQSAEMQAAVRVLGGLTMLGLMGMMSVVTWLTVKRQREEQRQLEALEELVMLRRWSDAAMVLQGILSRPMRSGLNVFM